jgi:hypothetical protein
MTRIVVVTAAVVSLVLVVLALRGCRTSDERLKLARPANNVMDFYGLAVDQDGKPLAGVAFNLTAIAVEGNPFRGEQKDIRTMHTVATDANGKLQLHTSGERLEVDAKLPGYRLLSDRDTVNGRHRDAGHNLFFQYYNWGDVNYAGDPANPAIYVMVKDGATVVTAKLSRGGAEGLIQTANGVPWSIHWPNQPGFPRSPSIKGLTFREPATRPATATSSTQP